MTTTVTLTADQQRAVESTARETLVIAGAGSGKTRVLTERIAHLINDHGASPNSSRPPPPP